MRCAEMFEKNERCPYAPIASQDVACWYSVFSGDYDHSSTDTICQYARFTARCYASAVLAMALCLSVRLSVCHESVFY